MPATFIYAAFGSARSGFDEGSLAMRRSTLNLTRATKVPVALHDEDHGRRASLTHLASLEDHLLLLDSRSGMLIDQAKELYRRTQGHIGSLTNLLDRASYLAITTVESITPEILSMVTIDNAAETSARTA